MQTTEQPSALRQAAIKVRADRMQQQERKAAEERQRSEREDRDRTIMLIRNKLGDEYADRATWQPQIGAALVDGICFTSRDATYHSDYGHLPARLWVGAPCVGCGDFISVDIDVNGLDDLAGALERLPDVMQRHKTSESKADEEDKPFTPPAPTGGMAFPDPGAAAAQYHGHSNFESGMTLRDYFAAKAMQGFIANDDPHENWGPGDYDDHARDAIVVASFQFADAMLKARKQ